LTDSSKSELFWSHDALEIKGAARGFVKILLGINNVGRGFTEEVVLGWELGPIQNEHIHSFSTICIVF
jgi:hypothetical protein